MKKKYEKPRMRTVLLHGPVVMLGGSNQVNSYQKGTDFTVGDDDQ